MAQFFKPSKSKKNPRILKNVHVESLDHHLQGVVKHAGKTYFVAQSLPGEVVDIEIGTNNRAKLKAVHTHSEERVCAPCKHYQQCGGCDTQHLANESQLKYKAEASRALIQRFSRYTHLPQPLLIESQSWQYRRVTRLSTWFEKHWVLGFRQSSSKKICEFEQCLVLRPALQDLIAPLRSLIRSWPKNLGLGHIELIEAQLGVSAKIRTRKSFSSEQNQQLLDFAKRYLLELSLEDDEGSHQLQSGLNQYSLLSNKQLQFSAGDFIQVNASCNQQLVDYAVTQLKLEPEDRVLDLFCGLGNFSLDIAAQAKQVMAVEGSSQMVKRLQNNAALNHLRNIDTKSGNLLEHDLLKSLFSDNYNKLLLDPARAGAQSVFEVLRLPKFAKFRPQIVVYVSCDPATLGRDAAALKEMGYHFDSLCFVDMFPQTQHLESVATFSLQ